MIHKNVVFFCNKFVWVGDLALQNSDSYFRLVYMITLRTFFWVFGHLSSVKTKVVSWWRFTLMINFHPQYYQWRFTAVSFRTRSVEINKHYGEYGATRANKRNIHGRYFLQLSIVWFLQLFSGYRDQTYFKMHFEEHGSKKALIWFERCRTTTRKDTTHWTKFDTSPESPWEVSL